jgi:hypothetical protein
MTYSIIIDKQPGGEISLSSNFSENIVLTSSGEERIVSVKNISGLEVLNTLSTTIIGENNTTKLLMYYRIALSHDPENWSEWIEVSPNGDSDCFVEVSPFYDYNIDIKFVRTGSSSNGELVISDFIWKGTWDANSIETPVLDLTTSISPVILDVKDTYKVFSLEGYELVAKNIADLEIHYRISQNDKRTWSQWTLLTTENIKTEKIDPIRFFNIQYKFTHIGNSGTIQIRDLNLYGSYINISQNYTTANLMGLRENCKNGVIGNTGLNAGTGSNNLSMTSGLQTEPSVWSTLDKNDGDLFNPYNLGGAIDMYNELANQATDLGGWKVEYFRTNPDENGIDHSIHEYSLFGVVADGEVKIMVPNNQFPSNQVAFNQFDLALLESFEVHLTKQQFKSVFGEEHRPRREDFLYFCDISRMYRVEHAQAIRDFGNSSVYYKLILGKYNKKANVQPTNTTLQDKINSIVQNSTLEDLFGTQKQDDKKEVAFKDQQQTLSQTYEKIRSKIIAPVEKELIENAELVLSKYHYNLSKVDPGADAVLYQSSDIYLRQGDNRSFISWFKLYDYADSDSYNLLNNYSNDLSLGYKFDIENGNLVSTINNATYSMSVSDYLTENIWYAVLINIDQRQRKIKHHLFKRNVLREIDAKNLNSTKLKLLVSEELDYTPNEYEVKSTDITMKITASNMKITNLRVFDDIIEESEITKIMNQQVLRDTDHVILGDNSNRVMVLPNYPYN